MEIAQQKQMLRAAVRAQARTLDDAYRQSASAAICGHLTAHPAYRAAAVVLAFVGTKREVDTEALLRGVWADGKTLCVPRCKEGHLMDLCAIRSYDDLDLGAYGILEPTADCPLVAAQDIDFAVIPCLTFDRAGNRLGQGGGYYDRFLSQLTCPTFLVCREKLVVGRVPCEAHDRRCDYLVTERGIFTPQTADGAQGAYLNF